MSLTPRRRAPSRAPIPATVVDFPPDAMGEGETASPLSNGCGQVQAMDRQTDALKALTAELKAARETFTPAAHAIKDLGDAQKKLCEFLIGHRLKLVGGLVGLLVAVGAISPNAAEAISHVFKALGWA